MINKSVYRDRITHHDTEVKKQRYIKRKCLKCDKSFKSSGNRICLRCRDSNAKLEMEFCPLHL